MSGCLDPYSTADITAKVNFLVVDSFINTTDSTATVRLTRTIPMNVVAEATIEADATVSVESDDQTVYNLSYRGDGVYLLDKTYFNSSDRYRVNIRTSSGNLYQSDFVEMTSTPPIDSITWIPKEEGIDISTNTHDPSGQSRYYSWTYDVTWEFVASFVSSYKLVDGAYFPRLFEEQIYRCWSYDKSDAIYVASSSTLSEDVIRSFPLAYVPVRSNRLNFRYSILVKQRSLTKEAYEFWSELEKTTETLGGLFDPQPYQLSGNIRNADDPNDVVLGYFSGGSVTQKRLFITFNELPGTLRVLRNRIPCDDERLSFLPIGELSTTPNSVYLIDPVSPPGGPIIGFTTADASCADCRALGGFTTKPDFWP